MEDTLLLTKDSVLALLRRDSVEIELVRGKGEIGGGKEEVNTHVDFRLPPRPCKPFMLINDVSTVSSGILAMNRSASAVRLSQIRMTILSFRSGKKIGNCSLALNNGFLESLITGDLTVKSPALTATNLN